MNILTRIESIRAREHEATVELVAALVECDRCEAHLAHGYSGIWDFLVRHLHYSNAAASRRYKTMKIVRAHPEVLTMLRKHQVNLSTLAMAESALSRSGGPKALLQAMVGKSQRQVEELLARANPGVRKQESVRRVAVKVPAASGAPLFAESATSAGEVSGTTEEAGATSAAEVSRAAAEPLATSAAEAIPTSPAEVDERVHLSFSVSAASFEQFERAKAILSRKLPSGVTLEQAFGELVDFYLKHKAPKERPAKGASPKSTSRHIPEAIRDEVTLRDRGRCTFVGPTGQRCGSTHDIEIDHIQPFALGGSHDPENLRLLCGRHNRHRARQTFGAFHCGEAGRIPVPQRK